MPGRFFSLLGRGEILFWDDGRLGAEADLGGGLVQVGLNFFPAERGLATGYALVILFWGDAESLDRCLCGPTFARVGFPLARAHVPANHPALGPVFSLRAALQRGGVFRREYDLPTAMEGKNTSSKVDWICRDLLAHFCRAGHFVGHGFVPGLWALGHDRGNYSTFGCGAALQRGGVFRREHDLPTQVERKSCSIKVAWICSHLYDGFCHSRLPYSRGFELCLWALG